MKRLVVVMVLLFGFFLLAPRAEASNGVGRVACGNMLISAGLAVGLIFPAPLAITGRSEPVLVATGFAGAFMLVGYSLVRWGQSASKPRSQLVAR